MRTASALVLGFTVAAVAVSSVGVRARADTVVLANGKRLENVVVSRQDDEVVVVNPWNSRHPDMTWEIPDKNRIPRERVEEVIVALPPLHDLWLRDSAWDVSFEERIALADLAESLKMKDERRAAALSRVDSRSDERRVAQAARRGRVEALGEGQPARRPRARASRARVPRLAVAPPSWRRSSR